MATTTTRATLSRDEISFDTRDPVDLLLEEASRYPLLTAAEEVYLAKRVEKGDLDAKNRMVNSNVRLVVSIARRYQGQGMSMADLVQEGMLGLIRAVEKFDWRRGYKFSTYATLWIRQSLQRGLDNTARTIRLPAHISQRVRRVRRLERELTVRLEREPTDEELGDEAGLDADEVSELRAMDYTPPSLDSPVGDEDSATLGQLVALESSRPDEEVERNELSRGLQAAIEMLPEQERRVIEARFGAADGPAATKPLGVSRKQADELERRALARLAEMASLQRLRDAA